MRVPGCKWLVRSLFFCDNFSNVQALTDDAYEADAINWIAEIDYDAWKRDGFPVLRGTEMI